MEISIRISHSSKDDLEQIRSLAGVFGFATVTEAEFMGRRHTELQRNVDLATLQGLIQAGAGAANP